ncbi:uncharacterized protein LOC135383151 isoform X1 [Ornithodoros turicata]|uniref:uncharacterized protein LOC135383151 isoform X1 n=1 Tax=Ornithodoros turicata TaxID=34597 RepID=UPI00313979AE
MPEKQLIFYTGISKARFLALLAAIVVCLPQAQKIPHSAQLLMVLMKLRLALPYQDLAYRFNVHRHTVSSTFKIWIKPLAILCSHLVKFPSPSVAQSWLTKTERRKFPRLRCIIDCTEVKVSRPHNLDTQQVVWSNYKQTSTLKYLVCVNNAGSVAFISKAYGGRISDKSITRKSGFLDLLNEKDQVLADRGFLLHDEFALRNVELITPTFTKNKQQLSALETTKSRRISSTRIIVERAIGYLKKWRILTGTVPYQLCPMYDDILVVVSGLTNVALPIAKKGMLYANQLLYRTNKRYLFRLGKYL